MTYLSAKSNPDPSRLHQTLMAFYSERILRLRSQLDAKAIRVALASRLIRRMIRPLRLRC